VQTKLIKPKPVRIIRKKTKPTTPKQKPIAKKKKLQELTPENNNIQQPATPEDLPPIKSFVFDNIPKENEKNDAVSHDSIFNSPGNVKKFLTPHVN
jgi:hypothetical protein